MKKPAAAAAFSLVEITFALGVAAFCLLAVFGLIPVGVQTNRSSTSQTTAANLATSIVADLRGTGTTGLSSLYCITLGNVTTIYCDNHCGCSRDVSGVPALCGSGANTPTIKTLYRATVTFPLTGNLTYANVKITWPAEADPATTTPSGSVEMFAALNRH